MLDVVPGVLANQGIRRLLPPFVANDLQVVAINKWLPPLKALETPIDPDGTHKGVELPEHLGAVEARDIFRINE